MRHCVVMTIYTDLQQVNNFIKTMPQGWDIYVHVDKKSDIDVEYINSRAYVLKCFDVYWGSFNHISAFMRMLEIAYGRGNYDYFHLVSGQDFLCKSSNEIDKRFDNGKIYLDIVSDPGWYNGGYDIFSYRTLSRFCDIRKPFNRKLNNLFKRIQEILNIKRSYPKYAIYGGSVYCSLTQEAVKECFRSHIAKDLLSKLKYSSIGEEIFFQTVLMNSSLKSKIIRNNLRYIDWSGEVRPKVLAIEDFKKIVDSDAVFCRKVDSVTSEELTSKLCDYYDLINNSGL